MAYDVLTEAGGFLRALGVPGQSVRHTQGTKRRPWQTGNTERLLEATKRVRLCPVVIISQPCSAEERLVGRGTAGGELPWLGVRTASPEENWWDPCRLQDGGDGRQVGRARRPPVEEQPGQGWRLCSGVVGGKTLVSLLNVESHSVTSVLRSLGGGCHSCVLGPEHTGEFIPL